MSPSMSRASQSSWLWLVHAFNLLFLLGVTTRGLYGWRRLPERVPIHFNFQGVADRFTEKGPEFALIFVMPWFMVGLLYAMRAAMGYFLKHPDQANLPRSIRALPAERQVPVLFALQDLLLGCATAANLALGMVAWGALQVGLGVYQQLPSWTTFPWLVLLAVVVIGGAARLIAVAAGVLRARGAPDCEP